MVLLPAVNWLANTVSDAVATPPETVRLTIPRDTLPSVNVTDPVGMMLPVLAMTTAVSTVLAPAVTLAGLAVTVVVVEVTGPLFHCVTRLYASTEPRPVVRSYPGPAL